MFYDGYHFGGMHIIWWFLWFGFLFWIFALPYKIPFEMGRKDSLLYILQIRFASGQITRQEYMDQRELLRKGIK
jgi:putative membrane protein